MVRDKRVRDRETSTDRVRLGVPEMRGTGISELRLIAGVNESIKEAVAVSGKIRLMAVNAGLIASRSGNRAAGFCIVAAELGRFSDRMVADMNGWSTLIHGIVRETARERRQAHTMYKLQSAAHRSENSKVAMEIACELSRRSLDAMTARNSKRLRELLQLIQKTEKNLMTGHVIASSALIEAAYGGSMKESLQRIAGAIGDRIRLFSECTERVGWLMRRAIG